MAIAKICDRCGDFYETYNTRQSEKAVNGFCFLNIDSKGQYFSGKAHDLCRKCVGELQAWFKGADDENANRNSCE